MTLLEKVKAAHAEERAENLRLQEKWHDETLKQQREFQEQMKKQFLIGEDSTESRFLRGEAGSESRHGRTVGFAFLNVLLAAVLAVAGIKFWDWIAGRF